jgi:hypothetical protein
VADDGPFMPYGLTIQRFMLVTPPSYVFQALKCRFWSVIRPAGRASLGSSNEGLASPFLPSQSAASPALEQFSTPPCQAPSSSHSTGRFFHFNTIRPCPSQLMERVAVICRSGYRSLQGSLFAPSSSAHEAPVFFFGLASRFQS